MHNLRTFITQRQSERLWVVGSSEATELIERGFREFMKLLNDHLAHSSFLWGISPPQPILDFMVNFFNYWNLTQHPEQSAMR